jgi:hypothetical protein
MMTSASVASPWGYVSEGGTHLGVLCKVGIPLSHPLIF